MVFRVDDHHDVVALDSDAKVIGLIRVEHSAAGLGELVRWLKGIAGPEEVACVIETRHGILVNTLLEARFSVYPVNPKTVDRHRQASRAKTDAIDAMILARHGLHEIDRLRRLEPDSPVIQELKLLTRDQAALIRQQTRLTNQLTACLKEHYPLALEIFSRLNQPVTLAFLEAYPTMEHLKAADPEEIAGLLKRYRHPRPRETVQKIMTMLGQPQLRSSPIVTIFAPILTAHSSRAFPGQEGVWAQNCWQNGATTGAATCRTKAWRPWRVHPRSPSRAGATSEPESASRA